LKQTEFVNFWRARCSGERGTPRASSKGTSLARAVSIDRKPSPGHVPHGPRGAVFRLPGVCGENAKRKMFKPRRISAPPILPEGMRIYAVGDIHGRADLLRQLFSRIDEDVNENPAAQAIEVFLGDYIDRGQDSAAVLDLLIERGLTRRICCLKGNHESFLFEFLDNPGVFKFWAQFGALPTLASYGVAPTTNPGPKEQAELSASLRAALPESHRAFLARLKPSFTCGDFFFVHAGVRPRVSLSCQREEDLLWIRDAFLSHTDPFEKMIVHGHSPVKEPEVRKNRINIDTGAYATGRLTCLKLEGGTLEFIQNIARSERAGI
jgi:serine/threonine protein phosphatase 1